MQKTTTFLMFEGRAEEALNYYTSLFTDSEIISITRFESDLPDGKIMNSVLRIYDQEYILMDSPIKHDFNFTPSISIFVKCETEDEIDKLFTGLSSNGNILMPLEEYPFSKKFAWISDRFGVSWQLSLIS
jgi:predicted 3-demethylubiquinone-9 3-methyltransferase (glyoxalase superfamily)